MTVRLGLYPAKVSNAYLPRMKSILSRRFQVVMVPHVKWLQLNRLRSVGPKLDVMLVSWLDDTLVSRKTGRMRRSGPLLFRLKMRVLRRLAKRLVMVCHNEFPHYTRRSDQGKVKAFIDAVEREFDAVITHSGHNADGRFYVPHPLYDRSSAGVDPDSPPYCLAFGQIKPYKNLLALVRHWQGPATLVVAGSASDWEYVEALKEAAVGKPVEFRLGFLPEEDAAALMKGASCAVLAHAGEDMVVSGSYFYAISQGTPVFALTSPFLRWLTEVDGPGVRCFESVEGLAREAGLNERRLSSEEAEDLVRRAEAMFGDEVVVRYVEEVVEGVMG